MSNLVGIYKITSPSNKIYIGQSRNIEYRFYQYRKLCCKCQKHLYRSLLKYGYENHRVEIIELCDFEKLSLRERYWQEYYEVLSDKGLNCTLVDTSDKPKIISQETRLKISDSHKGKIISKEAVEKCKITKQAKGVVRSENALLSDELVHTICKLFSEGKQSKEVSKLLPECNYTTIVNIKQGLNYKDISSLYKFKAGKLRRKIICVEDDLIFNTQKEVMNYYNISQTVVNKAVNNLTRSNSTGKSFKYVRT